MIKVYLDWNVMSQMKNGTHPDLHKIILNNEDLFIAYSTSHIGDITSGYKQTNERQQIVKSDMDFISKITGNKCYLNTGTEILMETRDPLELFDERISDVETFRDLSIDGLFKSFEDSEIIGDLISPLKELLKSIPLDPKFKEAFENPESADQMNKMFPGLKDNFTMEGFFKSFSEINLAMNNDEHYKKLRQIMQSGLGINRDRMFNFDDPYRLIEQHHEARNFSIKIDNSKNAPSWYNDITNEYLLLDMHGYQEDNVNIKKGRMETFRNTSEDASHSAFASMFDFYVINDKKSYKKTKAVYEKLGINTIVLKPDEFVDHYNKYLLISNPLLNLTIPFEILKEFKYIEDKLDGATLRTYLFPYFLYSFFNKILMFIDDQTNAATLLLGRNKPTNGIIYISEIRHLVKRISEVWGKDIDGFNEVEDGEFSAETWRGRRWQFDNFLIRLVCSSGAIQLYLEPQ